jgi:hypothetical protein
MVVPFVSTKHPSVVLVEADLVQGEVEEDVDDRTVVIVMVAMRGEVEVMVSYIILSSFM